MFTPARPKIYHIVHIDRLASIIDDGKLWCDSVTRRLDKLGTSIGMNRIKDRRLSLELTSHPGLNVGDCVPFYFCPRSVMLYKIYKANDPDLTYRGGQSSILHFEIDLRDAVAWATANDRRWAITSSNASSFYFEDYADLEDLHKLDWDAINAMDWSGRQDVKQAEWLVERSFPWELVKRVGVISPSMGRQVANTMRQCRYRPTVQILRRWYY